MVITKEIEQKTYTLRMPKELWYFMRILSLDSGVSMNTIIIDSLESFRKKMEKRMEKKLTTS